MSEQTRRKATEVYVDECLAVMKQTLTPEEREAKIQQVLKALPPLPKPLPAPPQGD